MLLVLAAIAVVDGLRDQRLEVVRRRPRREGADEGRAPKHAHAAPRRSVPRRQGPSAARRTSRSAAAAPAGAVVFQGTVEKGETEPFRGKSFWLNVSTPENLVITVGGKRVRRRPPAARAHGHADRAGQAG